MTLVVPVYNDWDSLRILLRELDEALLREYRIHLVIVDDSSTQPQPYDLIDYGMEAIASATCLRLKCNVGHQRAIAIGFSWLASSTITYPVIVMDGDGEDKPSELLRMLERFMESGEDKAVFAERSKRSESWLFKTFYRIYRSLHRIMVGLPVKIGNFSVVPFSYI
jgi:glycosyltransferase involved in cell wall biosynthesis